MIKHRHRALALALSSCTAALLPFAANAHHAMDNATPGNALQGLVSGLAHPLIGLDHFLFVVAIGIACYYFGRTAAALLAFIAGTLAGTVVHLYKATLPYPDVWVALSLMLLGYLFFRGQRFLKSKAAFAFFGLSGLAHGYAYGESIVGAETTPLLAYLIGFAVVQFALAFGGYASARYVQRKKPDFRTSTAVGGVLAIAGVGAVFLALM